MSIRSISSRVIASLVRSYSLVVRGDSWAAMAWAFSMILSLSTLVIGVENGFPAGESWIRAGHH